MVSIFAPRWTELPPEVHQAVSDISSDLPPRRGRPRLHTAPRSSTPVSGSVEDTVPRCTHGNKPACTETRRDIQQAEGAGGSQCMPCNREGERERDGGLIRHGKTRHIDGSSPLAGYGTLSPVSWGRVWRVHIHRTKHIKKKRPREQARFGPFGMCIAAQPGFQKGKGRGGGECRTSLISRAASSLSFSALPLSASFNSPFAAASWRVIQQINSNRDPEMHAGRENADKNP